MRSVNARVPECSFVYHKEQITKSHVVMHTLIFCTHCSQLCAHKLGFSGCSLGSVVTLVSTHSQGAFFPNSCHDCKHVRSHRLPQFSAATASRQAAREDT